jgi:hypothetical protein
MGRAADASCFRDLGVMGMHLTFSEALSHFKTTFFHRFFRKSHDYDECSGLLVSEISKT